jgi:hypothetical protein
MVAAGGIDFGDETFETNECIIIPISDGTVMILCLWGDRVGLGKAIRVDGAIKRFYWSRCYDLANPHDFDHIIHLVRKNVSEFSSWPHTRREHVGAI